MIKTVITCCPHKCNLTIQVADQNPRSMIALKHSYPQPAGLLILTLSEILSGPSTTLFLPFIVCQTYRNKYPQPFLWYHALPLWPLASSFVSGVYQSLECLALICGLSSGLLFVGFLVFDTVWNWTHWNWILRRQRCLWLGRLTSWKTSCGMACPKRSGKLPQFHLSAEHVKEKCSGCVY